ncbi:MAG TPA: tripartite tricarboxylate transporter substrate binding protein [Burkholderiales bacterium]|nr:tripartite tricarboxylate transporter substrate binding protein [Burkholderiales bacterium]
MQLRPAVRWLPLFVLLCSTYAAAQTFPARPLRLVVPFAPGGIADLSARIVGQKMEELLGQTVVIDNRGGAGGALGAETVTRAKPDGYTMLLCSSSVMVINPLLTGTSAYDPQRDLAGISLISSSPYVLLVHPASPFGSVRDLIAAAKAKPGALNFGSAGVGSASHLVGEVFKSAAGVNLTHVPYKGSGPAAIDLLAGQLHMMFEAISASLPNIKAGRLRPLGIATLKPFPVTPDVPTISEAGVPGFEGTTWQGLCAPAKTPAPVLQTLNKAAVEAVKSHDIAQRFASLGVIGVGTSPGEFRAFIQSETARWRKAIRDAGIKVQ